MTQIAPLLLRADADAQPGNSHLVRLLALGSAWQARGGQVVCLGHVASPVMQQRIRQTGATFIPLRCRYPHPDDLAIVSQQIALMHQQAGPDGTVWTAVDGHHFDVEYQGEIRALGSRLLVIDDLADACRYDADLVLNQNPGIDERRYTGSVGSETTLLLGARYALLPPRFGRYRPLRAAVSEVARSVLIAFDGADPLDLTSKALAAVEQAAVPHLRVRVLVGASNRHTAALRAWARRRPGQVELVFAPFNRAAEMAAADMAVTAAGDTCFELACMQTPALVIATTPAQAPTAQAMARAGAMIDLGPARELSMQHMAAAVQSLGLSPQARSRQIDFGRALVDGVGAARVTAVMRALDGELTPDDIALRPLDSTDCWPLWRTKPGLSLHLNSHATDPIPPDEHRRWFGEKLASETARIWVASLHGLILGVVRYDRADATTAEISFHVVRSCRRRGLGTRLIAETCNLARKVLSVQRLRAIVRIDNESSARVFRKTGFEEVAHCFVRGQECFVLEQAAPAEAPNTAATCYYLESAENAISGMAISTPECPEIG